MFDRITFDPKVDEIREEYPDLEPEDIRQALQYAAA